MSARSGRAFLSGGTGAFRQLQPRDICPQCLRSFSTTSRAQAGHNKWSKTKHIKAVTDKKKMAERTAFTKLIAMYSKSRSMVYRHVLYIRLFAVPFYPYKSLFLCAAYSIYATHSFICC